MKPVRDADVVLHLIEKAEWSGNPQVLRVPEDTDPEALRHLQGRFPGLIIALEDVEALDTAEMNARGWYRREQMNKLTKVEAHKRVVQDLSATRIRSISGLRGRVNAEAVIAKLRERLSPVLDAHERQEWTTEELAGWLVGELVAALDLQMGSATASRPPSFAYAAEEAIEALAKRAGVTSWEARTLLVDHLGGQGRALTEGDQDAQRIADHLLLVVSHEDSWPGSAPWPYHRMGEDSTSTNEPMSLTLEDVQAAMDRLRDLPDNPTRRALEQYGLGVDYGQDPPSRVAASVGLNATLHITPESEWATTMPARVAERERQRLIEAGFWPGNQPADLGFEGEDPDDLYRGYVRISSRGRSWTFGRRDVSR